MIDTASLREDLKDYYGTAKELNPAATIDLIEVENADIDKLKKLAKDAGLDLADYVIFYDGD